MRDLKFTSRRVVLEFWIPEETWSTGLFLMTEFSWSISLELLLVLLVACWLVLLLICESGIGELDI